MNFQMILVRGTAAVVGTALLAVAMWLYTVRPGVRAETLEPIRTEGEVGAVVDTPDFRVQVQRVDAARSLKGVLGRTARTEGVFLIVRLRGMSRKEPRTLRSAVLETPGGLSFTPDPRIGVGTSNDPELLPMLWTEAYHVFELPPKALTGARLVVGTGGLTPQLSAAAEIDLGLTSARATRMIEAAAEGYDPRAGRP